MRNKQRKRPDVIVWRQFGGKGYCAFASLHRQVCIGILSVATLGMAARAHARQNTAALSSAEVRESTDETEMTELTVSGTMAPLTELQSARIVSVLTRQDIEQAAVQSINDLFKLVTGVDVRQRGGFGIQTDISIDGGTCDQVTILLNGIDIGNTQTGHFSADFPVSISDIERIEVLEGAASRVYGGQSFGGAVNIVTRHDSGQAVDFRAAGGSFGTAEGEARLALTTGRVGSRISGGGGRTDGGTQNSGWRKGQLYYQGDYEDTALRLDWQLGFSRKDYGANTFYSAAYLDQYERNERILASVSAETKGRFHFTPQVFWNRYYDNFELIRGDRFGENFHRLDVYGIKAGGYFSWKAGKTAVSAVIRRDDILSTNLGRDLDPAQYVAASGPGTGEAGLCYTRSDSRTTTSFSVEHNVLLPHWTLSAGIMASTTSGIDHGFRFYPGIDAAWRPTNRWKLLFSYNKGFRLPTFTELYYKSPTHEGNRDLKPEHNHSFSIGSQYAVPGASASIRGFYHRGTQMMDWVMYAPDDVFHSASFDLDNLGLQLQGKLTFPELMSRNAWVRSLSLGYTYIHQNRHDKVDIYKSNSALEYLRHKFVANVTHRIVSRLSMSWDVRWQQRMGSYMEGDRLYGYHPYWMLDAKLQWDAPTYNLYLQASNITNHTYHDLGSVPQPGIWVMAGARLRLSLCKN